MIELLLGVALATAAPLGVGLAVDVVSGRDVARRASLGSVVAVVPAIVALALPRGPLAAALVGPWLAATWIIGLVGLRQALRYARAGIRTIAPATAGILVSIAFLAVGSTWLVVDRAGIRPFGFATTIVLLTAVHFHVAGFVLTLSGSLAARVRGGPGIVASVVALVIGTPLTALGFFGYPAASLAGALLVAAGGIGIGLTLIGIGRTGAARNTWLVISGATLLVTMPLAAAYATGTTLGIPFLDIPAMAAIHGSLNVVAFAIPAMIGWQRPER